MLIDISFLFLKNCNYFEIVYMASMRNIYQKSLSETKTFLIQNLIGMIYHNLSQFVLDSILYKYFFSKLETQCSRNNSLG